MIIDALRRQFTRAPKPTPQLPPNQTYKDSVLDISASDRQALDNLSLSEVIAMQGRTSRIYVPANSLYCVEAQVILDESQVLQLPEHEQAAEISLQ